MVVNPKWKNRCPSGKLRYRDRREARAALHNMAVLREMGRDRRKECSYYRCPHCKGWHLTSRPYRHHEAPLVRVGAPQAA